STAGTNSWAGDIILVTDTTIAVDAGLLTLSGQLGGPGGLTRSGAGILQLTGSSTYSGTTTVTGGGTLQVNGLPPTSAVSVTNRSKLSGNGTINAVTVRNGTISPGNSPGILTLTGDLSLDTASSYEVDVYTPDAGSGFDQLR